MARSFQDILADFQTTDDVSTWENKIVTSVNDNFQIQMRIEDEMIPICLMDAARELDTYYLNRIGRFIRRREKYDSDSTTNWSKPSHPIAALAQAPVEMAVSAIRWSTTRYPDFSEAEDEFVTQTIRIRNHLITSLRYFYVQRRDQVAAARQIAFEQQIHRSRRSCFLRFWSFITCFECKLRQKFPLSAIDLPYNFNISSLGHSETFEWLRSIRRCKQSALIESASTIVDGLKRNSPVIAASLLAYSKFK